MFNQVTAESRTFGAAMAATNTMAGKSGKEFAAMKQQVAELAKDIPIARDELAGGLYQVISNGVPEDNWIDYLRSSAESSVGGIANLGEVVKVTSTIIKNYGLEWSNAGEIQDKIQLTAKNGVTSFEQMAQALPRVTAQASTLGVSIDELMASFATLTGVSGNILRRLVLSLLLFLQLSLSLRAKLLKWLNRWVFSLTQQLLRRLEVCNNSLSLSAQM